jgi:hypothetical protein
MTTEIVDISSIDSGALVAAEKAMLDTNIVTAKQYPRNVTECLDQAESLALRNIESAEKCWYTLPPFGGQGDPVIGPSIRLSEIIAPTWKNLRYGARPMDIDDKCVTAQGYCYDMENNVYYTTIKRRPIVGKNGKRYSDRVIETTMLACLAIAERDAVFKVIPRVFANDIMDKAMAMVEGNEEGLEARIDKAIEFCKKTYGVDEKTLCRTIGAQSKDQITSKKLTLLRGYLNAIKDGSAKAEDIFKPEQPSTPAATSADTLAEKLEKRKPGRTAKQAEPEPEIEPEPETGEVSYPFDNCETVGELCEWFSERAGIKELSRKAESDICNEAGIMSGFLTDGNYDEVHRACVLLYGK